MTSSRRATTSRQEPKTFDSVIANVNESVCEVAVHLRSLVLATLKDVTEAIYGGSKVSIALYSVGGANRVICGIQPSGSRCLFYLHRVEPEDVLELKLKGKGKQARHLEFAAREEVPDEVIKRLLELSRQRLG